MRCAKVQIAEWVVLGQRSSVRAFRAIIAAALALAWLPLAAHCSLSALPGLEFFQCTVEAAAPASHDSNSSADPCHEDGGCCAVESDQYQSTRQQPLDRMAPGSVLLIEPSTELELPIPVRIRRCIRTAAPPELSVGWQFSLRTALPVRAPSSAS